jgi:serine protease Do
MYNQKKNLLPAFIVALGLIVLPACSGLPLITAGNLTARSSNVVKVPVVAQAAAATPVPVVSAPAAVAVGEPGLVAAYEGVLQDIYTRVDPSVVAIRVVSTASVSDLQQQVPGFGSQGNTPQTQEALGSGFVWDTLGHIVTNNHVIAGADKIEVTFADGTIVPATLVGADPDSDLAVIKVDVPAAQLQPVQMADSTQVKVGQLAIALGNPYGLENTMTVGIVSALGRTLPAGDGTTASGYSIPDIIQTDAPINPGNSGGILVDANGQVMGVTSAIESSSRANAGIGFVIPAQIVSRVAPALIKDGKFVHSWLGISGASLTPDLATADNLAPTQRGVLVAEVVSGSPADKAGVKASTSKSDANGQTVPVGGDVITAVDGQKTDKVDDLISYLASSTEGGQNVTLTILRDGKEQTLSVTLAARPASTTQQASAPSQSTNPSNAVYLGIKAVELNDTLDKDLSLPNGTTGLLVQQLDPAGPASAAGMLAGAKPVLVNGRLVVSGGDIIQAVDGQSVSSLKELNAALGQHQPGDDVTISVLRAGSQVDLNVTLAARPN